MKKFFKDQYLQLLRKQGAKAGIVPVKNPDNENERLDEVKRFVIIELKLFKLYIPRYLDAVICRTG